MNESINRIEAPAPTTTMTFTCRVPVSPVRCEPFSARFWGVIILLCTRTIFIGTFNLLRVSSKFTMSTIANEDSSFAYTTYTESQSCSRGFCRSYWASEDGAICRSADSSFNKIQWDANDRNDCDLKVLSGSISCSEKCGGFKDLRTGAQAGRIGCSGDWNYGSYRLVHLLSSWGAVCL